MIYEMNDTRYKSAFTLVELLVAMVVASIVLTAVATLAYALGTANDVTDDTSHKQAQVRYATLRISELIRGCKLICGAPGDDLAIWRADDNGDGNINPAELIYIEAGVSRNYIRLLEFLTASSAVVSLSDIQSGQAKITLTFSYDDRQTILIPQCSNVQFSFDISSPQCKFVSVSFDLSENEAIRRYQINAALRSWAGHLLNAGADGLVSDDD